MDDTDMGGTTDPGHEAGSAFAVEAPPGPEVPTQRQVEAREHFDTPSWIGPNRPWQQFEPTIPAQAEPVHDYSRAPTPLLDGAILSEGHWVEHAPPRRVAGTLLIVSILGLIGALVATVITQSPVAIGAAVACAVVVVAFRVALMSSGVRTVELKNGRLTVSQDGLKDIINLSDPAHLVELVGSPTDALWRLRLETIDGRLIELTPLHVNPTELHPAVAHFRSIADRERADRERRFNR